MTEMSLVSLTQELLQVLGSSQDSSGHSAQVGRFQSGSQRVVQSMLENQLAWNTYLLIGFCRIEESSKLRSPRAFS